VVNYGRVGKYNMRKSKRYATNTSREEGDFDIYLAMNIYFLFCRTNGMRGLIVYVVNRSRARKCIMWKSKRHALCG
jgi:hypothetical protein